MNEKDVPVEPKKYNDYLAKWRRPFDDREEAMNYVHYLARGKGKKLEAMRTGLPLPGFDSLLFLPGQVADLPLLDDEPVELASILGPRARKPLKLRIPVYISHMSYGSLSPESMTAMARSADCVAIATAVMMAIDSQQYRVCHNNTCPVGIATQKSGLRARFDIQISAGRLENFLEATEAELLDFCRMTGRLGTLLDRWQPPSSRATTTPNNFFSVCIIKGNLNRSESPNH